MATSSVTILASRKGGPAIGHLVQGFRNTKVMNPALIAEAFDALVARLQVVETVLKAPVDLTGTNAIAVYEVTLTAASTDIIPPFGVPFIGAILSVIITCDGTDGRQITWDTVGGLLKGLAVDDIDNRANKVNSYLFLGRSDAKWWCVATRLGM